jgi:predicted transcriptional regulator
MNMQTREFTAHIPLPLAQKIDESAARLERSPDWIMEQALAAWIDQEEERRRLLAEAFEDVRAGRLIDHDKVLAWAESLDTEGPLSIPTC